MTTLNTTGRHIFCDFHKVVGDYEVFYNYKAGNSLEVQHVYRNGAFALLPASVYDALHADHMVEGADTDSDESEENEMVRVPEPYGFIIQHVDTCNSEYFIGHHLPNFSIMVDGTSTYQQIKDEMLDPQTTDHLDDELFYFSGSDRAFDEAVDELFSEVEDMEAIAFPSLEVVDYDSLEAEMGEYDVRAFFTVEILFDEDA